MTGVHQRRNYRLLPIKIEVAYQPISILQHREQVSKLDSMDARLLVYPQRERCGQRFLLQKNIFVFA
jgi:hypothetical protein